MIRFIPLEQRDNYNEILELYFYMVAMVTPFCPDDIFFTGTFYNRGNIKMPNYPVTQFYQVTKKRPRQRKNKYKELLRHYNIPETPNSSLKKRCENDALLAKRIIESAFENVPHNKSLYYFLYEGLPYDDFHVRKDRLKCLLTSYMDIESLEHSDLFFECANVYKLAEVFRYAQFASLPEAVRLMALLDVPVCPYCNRNFTTTISKSDGVRQGQFDHYLNKSQYPWFALSLLNMIPACGYCNQSKSDNGRLVLYPYKEGMDRFYRFRTSPVHGIGYLTGNPMNLDEFKVVGEMETVLENSNYTDHIQNSLKIFHLNELYQTHQEHIAWIFRQRYIFSDTYLNHLCMEFPALFPSEHEARDMLYMRHISPEHWGEYPLSKLTHDIDEEITELENYFSLDINSC